MNQADIALDPMAGTGRIVFAPDYGPRGIGCYPVAQNPIDVALGQMSPEQFAANFLRSGILGIDPGTTQSGWCLFRDDKVAESGVSPNEELLNLFLISRAATLAIEMIASYGMPVGREVFETCVWIGRFMERWGNRGACHLVYRKDVKLHLCGSPRAKDGNVRQALIDLFPASGGGKTPQIGTKKQPGPLYGMSSHAWPALGVAITAKAKHEMRHLQTAC